MTEPTILYEDADIVAVNKPAGLMVHADGRSTEQTLADWVVKTFPEARDVGESIVTDEEIIERPGIVHRLDKETSGAMLVAKTTQGFDLLKSQFMDHSIKKIYLAFVQGVPKNTRGLIDKPIGRSATDFRQWSAEGSARGEMRDASTRYVVKESGHGYSFVQVMIETGRTHQIRVHFKAIRHPLVADKLYGDVKNKPGTVAENSVKNPLGFTRVALHSSILEFTNLEGKRVRVEAPLPEDFVHALNKLSE